MPRLRLNVAFPLAVLLVAAACTEGLRTPTNPSPAGPDGPTFTVSALAGKIVINEIMADPSAVTDASGEWFEVHNRADFAIVGNSDSNHTIGSSVSIPAGGFVVLAKNSNSGTNGGVTVAYAYGAMNLANTSDWVALRDGAGASVDSVAWATVMPAGSSRGVTDPDLDNLDAKGANFSHERAAGGRPARRAVSAFRPGFQADGSQEIRSHPFGPHQAGP
jgi:hypothetical protein